MTFEAGWLKRQVESAHKEVISWSPQTRERMVCGFDRGPLGGHRWGEVTEYPDRKVRMCQTCERMQVLYVWDTDWRDLKRGDEGHVVHDYHI